MRYPLAADPKLASEVSCRALRTLFSWQRRHARALGERPGRAHSCGAITFVQRFNSTLELSYHLHILIPDGLFVSDGEGPDHPPRFVELPPPGDAEVEHLLAQIVARTERHLRTGKAWKPDGSIPADFSAMHIEVAQGDAGDDEEPAAHVKTPAVTPVAPAKKVYTEPGPNATEAEWNLYRIMQLKNRR